MRTELSTEPLDKKPRKRLGLKGWLALVALVSLGISIGTLFFIKHRLQKEVATELKRIKESGEPWHYEQLASAYVKGLEKGNAAKTLQEAFTLLPTSASDELSKIISRYHESGRKLDDKAKDAILSILGKHQVAYDALDRALLHERAAFPLSWSSGYAMHVPHLSRMKSLSLLPKASAIIQMSEGRPAEVCNDIQKIFQLAAFLENESMVISQFVRILICTGGINTIEAALNQIEFTPAEIERLQQLLQSCQKPGPFTEALLGERVYGIEYLLWPERYPGVTPLSSPLLRFLKSTGFLAYEQKVYLRTMSQMIEASRTPFPQALDMAARVQAQIPVPREDEKGLALPLPSRGILVSMLLPGIVNALNRQGTLIAQARLAYTGLELQKQRLSRGFYPTTLNDLKAKADGTQFLDPFTGWTFHFQTGTNGFVLYSVGPDREDNGGSPRGSKQRRVAGLLVANKVVPKDHYDIPFKVERPVVVSSTAR